MNGAGWWSCASRSTQTRANRELRALLAQSFDLDSEDIKYPPLGPIALSIPWRTSFPSSKVRPYQPQASKPGVFFDVLRRLRRWHVLRHVAANLGKSRSSPGGLCSQGADAVQERRVSSSGIRQVAPSRQSRYPTLKARRAPRAHAPPVTAATNPPCRSFLRPQPAPRRPAATPRLLRCVCAGYRQTWGLGVKIDATFAAM